MCHRTYDNPTAMQVDLRKLDLSLPVETTCRMPTDPVSIDITATLQAP